MGLLDRRPTCSGTLPPPRSRESQTRRDRHQPGEGVDADISEVVDAVGQEPLDALVEPAQQRGQGYREDGRDRDALTVPHALDESLVDEDGHQTVLEQVGALFGCDPHPDHNHPVDGRDAERHPDLAPPGAPLQRTTDDGRYHQKEADDERGVQQVVFAKVRGQRPRQPQGGVDRHHHG